MIEVIDHTCDRGLRRIAILAHHESPPRGVKNFAWYDWHAVFPSASLRDPVATDIIEVVRAVHLADRAIRRSSLLGKRIRRLEVSIPVARPQAWRSVGPAVEALAGFASADEWRFNFVRAPGSGQSRRRERNEADATPWDVVALFSGGLDSLCGAAYRAGRSERVLFVTHVPPGRERVTQLLGDVWRAYGRSPDSALATVTFRLHPEERGPAGTRAMFHEYSRRSRPFFFLGLAAAVAVDAGVRHIQMSENGALGQSLPYRSDSYGGTLARQAHPHMLAGFASLLDHLAPRRDGGWQIENPLQAMTKGEACRLLGPATALAVRSISCEYVAKQAAGLRHWQGKRRNAAAAGYMGDGPQCGACLPCVVRRAALLSAGVDDPNNAYFFNARDLAIWESFAPARRPPLFDRVKSHPFYLRRFCRRLVSMSLREFAVQFLPELRLQPYVDGRASADPAEQYRLMRRYAREMLDFLEGKPASAAAPAFVPQEPMREARLGA